MIFQSQVRIAKVSVLDIAIHTCTGYSNSLKKSFFFLQEAKIFIYLFIYFFLNAKFVLTKGRARVWVVENPNIN